MATSVIREVIAAISKGPCAAVLKPAGFRRSAPHFWRDVGGINHAVHFQADQKGSGRTLTVNLGVSIPAVYERFFGRAFHTNRGTALWPIQVRLGFLMDGHDRWWRVTSADDVGPIGEDIAAALKAHALPFFDRLVTTADFVGLVRAPTPKGMLCVQAPLVMAILAAEEGNEQEARSHLSAAFAKQRGTPFEATVRQIAERLGIRLDEGDDAA
jgi:hypothetical protein